MEGRGQELPAVPPLLVGAEQEPGAKPRLQVDVLFRFGDERVAAQDSLSVFRMVEPDLEQGSNLTPAADEGGSFG